jgi:serine/threonine-protein kinase
MDLKPDNVMVSVDAGGALCVRLIDFGSTRVTGSIDGETLHLGTHSGISHTASYASPEVIAAAESGWVDAHVTLATDIYSFGLLALELLTATSATALWRQPPHVTAAKLAKSAGVPVVLHKLLLSTLTYEPELRPTAERLSSEFESALGTGPVVMAGEYALKAIAGLKAVCVCVNCFVSCCGC